MANESKKTLIQKIAYFFLVFIFTLAGGKIWHFIEVYPFRTICQNAAQETANKGNYDEAKIIYDECLKSFNK